MLTKIRRLSLRGRIALLTGGMILLVSLVLTGSSVYNAGDSFYRLASMIDADADVRYSEGEDSTDGEDLSEGEEPAEGESRGLKGEIETLPAFTIKLERRFNYWSCVSMLFVACAGMAASWVLAGKALTPVRNLCETVKSVEAGNLKQRIAAVETRDEIGELTVSFNNMLDRLEEAFEEQKRFSSNVAHELKTPLATLKTSLQIGRMELQGAGEGNESENGKKSREEEGEEDVFSVAGRSVDRLIRVVDDLLLLADDRILEREEFDVISMLKSVCDELLPAYADKKLDLRYDFQIDQCLLAGEQSLVRRIFFNLIENAMKYNREGGCLLVGAAAEEGTLTVSVSDQGPGIGQDSLCHIFEPFYCVDPSRSRKLGGAGLGLSIVKEIAERHGFSVEAESAPAVGSTFTVKIPLDRTHGKTLP